MRKHIGLNIALIGFTLFIMTGCTPPSPYAKGKSEADIPAHVNLVFLKEVTMADDDPHKHSEDGDPMPELDPSVNDQEVTAVVKKSILGQFKSFGYKTTENSQVKADIELRFFIYYMPERWPFAGGTVIVVGIIDDKNGKTLFKTDAADYNFLGVVGTVVGNSRDDMISEAGRDSVAKVIAEISKGTQNNISIK